MKRWPALVVLWLLVVVAAITVLLLGRRPAPVADVARANDLAQTAVEAWPGLTRADFPADLGGFTVVDASGRVMLARGTPVTTDLAAYQAHYATISLVKSETRVGTLYFDDGGRAVLLDRVARATQLALAGLVAVGVLGSAWLWWVDRRVLRPFRDLERFATDVAKGRLDAPLGARRGPAFGAFTQAFDVLRTELARSRAREAASQQARKTLVAQLSHDIRTPLAGIAATAEVMQLTNPDPRLDVVLDKARQIDNLTSALFDANAEQAEELPVTLVAFASGALAELVRDADLAGWVGPVDLPAVMVVADRHRLQQVIDNVVANAVKYGAAPLEATGVTVDDMLAVTLRDYGTGVPDEELPLITQPHYRASNAAGHPGQGLGLYTACTLMARMGGSLDLANVSDTVDGGHAGFAVTLTLACAERRHDPRRHAVGVQ